MVITQAPLRISFFGGGSDFPDHFAAHGGAVLATAIDKFSYVTVQPFNDAFFDHRLRVVYRRAESPQGASGIENPAIRACFERLGIDAGVELHHMADLPARTGLGSSSSFVVSMLQALHAHRGDLTSAEDLAREAIEIERGVLAEAGGYQDQIVAAYGGTNVISFSGRSGFSVHPIGLSAERIASLESHMVLAYTSIERISHDPQHGRPMSAADNRSTLCEMARLAEQGADVLTGRAPIAEFGRLLHRGWELKRSCGVSLPSIDAMYGKGIAAGASGGKLLGAGRGGFLLFIVAPACRAALAAALPGTKLIDVKINVPGSRVIFTQA